MPVFYHINHQRDVTSDTMHIVCPVQTNAFVMQKKTMPISTKNVCFIFYMFEKWPYCISYYLTRISLYLTTNKPQLFDKLSLLYIDIYERYERDYYN